MTKLCDQFLKYLSEDFNYSSDKMLCCDREEIEGIGCGITNNKYCDKEQSLLTQCRKIGEIDCNGRSSSSGDKAVADTVCADKKAWLCLSTNDVSFSSEPDAQRDWVISKRLLSNAVYNFRDSLKANPNSCGACCNKTSCNGIGNRCQCCNGSECDTNIKDGCQIPNGKTDCCQIGFDTCSTNKLNETRIGCPDLFKIGKEQECKIFPFPNGTDFTRTINYQTDLCRNISEPAGPGNKLSTEAIIGIVSGTVSFLIAVVGLFFAYKQLKVAYKDYKKEHKRRSEPESIELTEREEENKSEAEETEQVAEEIVEN